MSRQRPGSRETGGPLSGRSVLVTGGAHRVGGAISRHLGALGARVLVGYRSSAGAARELVAALPAGGAAYAADLATADGADALLDAVAAKREEPDAVVHAAASFEKRRLADTSAADWDRVMATNLRSFFLLARAFARLRAGRPGVLVAISDSAAHELWTGYLAHSVAKAALGPLVRILAKELAPEIRVAAVLPGPVLPPEGTTGEEREAMARRTLLGRLGRPRDVAEAVAFLLTCDFVTGAEIEVDGGARLWRGRG